MSTYIKHAKNVITNLLISFFFFLNGDFSTVLVKISMLHDITIHNNIFTGSSVIQQMKMIIPVDG